MRLRLDDLGTLLPATTTNEAADGSVVITASGLTLVLSPMGGQPAPGVEAGVLTSAAVGHDVPPGCSVQVGAEDSYETTLGWPMQLVHAQVLDAAGALVEDRLVASYRFLRYTATALIRVHSSADVAFATLRPHLTQLLGSGRPDWRAGEAGRVAALWDIWH